MAAGRRALLRATTLLLAAVLAPAAASPRAGSPGGPRSRVQVLSGSNWSLVLQGQWMLEFYAPWCPACQQIELTWERFAKESKHLDIIVGKVDITQEPGLSGRFFVTTLPTIYHANDGVFRRYRGSQTLEDLQGYVLERKWEAVEPVAGWKSPSSIMMHCMAGLFHISGWMRQIHNYLTGTLGFHVWMSYAIFILATLLIGLFLGLVLVLISDCLCPPKSRDEAETSDEAITKDNVENAALEEPEEAAELSADDAEETAGFKDLSDGEDAANSSADDSEEDLALGKESGEEEMEDLSEQPLADSETESSVRQRRSQVADNEL
ncbi:thioredoxin-related transmembrane protein 4 isoform X1 [Falco rusticolus]|uniref:thioredoxin-related transmembrane protein 4 isoform X1 n=1 Tax=Falco rusticolus TaxID=120794 RepID=UPI0018866F70|nr:thioredoxin-related transmembrane protein 4 isoform X1 [Falco rusticolus]XP_055581366.1 thioredoxin-related transmembrane protein 4 isoform X1 [Falco cherrug]